MISGTMRSYEKLILLSIATAFCFFCGGEKKPVTAPGEKPAAPFTQKPFDGIRALTYETEISDWGKLRSAPGGFPFVAPSDIAAVSAVVRWAGENKIALRVRGRGHSMDGRTFPGKNELLVLTKNLNRMKKIRDDLIEVGAGISLYAINQWLAGYGRILPIHNDGIVGPSLGGFISAGGIGRGSRHHGGFWNNVAEITFIDGTGQIQTIDAKNPVFRWLFGSMGQLGIIVSAKVKLIPLDGKELNPLPEEAAITEAWENDPHISKRTHDSYRNEYLYWFSVFAPASEEKELRAELNAIKAGNPDLMKYLPEYYWPMKFADFSPPLVFETQKDFVCIGLWGHLKPGISPEQKIQTVMKLEEEITKLLNRRPRFRRYIQAEVVPSASRLKTYFRPGILREFASLKKKYDPARLLNSIEGFPE